MKISRGAPSQRPLRGNRTIRDLATVRIDVLYHSAKFQLGRPRNKGEDTKKQLLTVGRIDGRTSDQLYKVIWNR